MGTPKSLQEALDRIITMRPPDGYGIRDWAKIVVRDYLSQKFSATLMKCKNNREEKLVMELWEQITGEKHEKKG